MAAYKHKVALSANQGNRLISLSKRGNISARKLARVHILLLAAQNRRQGGINDHEIHQVLNVSQATVIRVRKKFATRGLDAAIEELSRCGRPLTFDGYQRANHSFSLQYTARRTQSMVSEVASRPISGVTPR